MSLLARARAHYHQSTTAVRGGAGGHASPSSSSAFCPEKMGEGAERDAVRDHMGVIGGGGWESVCEGACACMARGRVVRVCRRLARCRCAHVASWALGEPKRILASCAAQEAPRERVYPYCRRFASLRVARRVRHDHVRLVTTRVLASVNVSCTSQWGEAEYTGQTRPMYT